MGYTSHTIQLIEKFVNEEFTSSPFVIDLGAQNNYSQPNLPAPYMSEWYKERGVEYLSIDINGENGSLPIDLSIPLTTNIKQACILVDAGVSEHIEKGGKHDIEAFYNCWKIKHDLLRVSGILFSENPKTGNWPGHGYNYVSKEFYLELEKISGLEIIDLHEHPAMGNDQDGWNIVCSMVKMTDKFPTLEEFKTLPVFKS